MITSSEPEGWRELQDAVAKILRECGFFVRVESNVPLARGSVNVDVFAEERINGRHYSIMCECKNWRRKVPKSVVHSFRTTLSDSGANKGYIITAAGFQSGAIEAAELTNVSLATWSEFQREFEAQWLTQFALPHLEELVAIAEEMSHEVEQLKKAIEAPIDTTRLAATTKVIRKVRGHCRASIGAWSRQDMLRHWTRPPLYRIRESLTPLIDPLKQGDVIFAPDWRQVILTLHTLLMDPSFSALLQYELDG